MATTTRHASPICLPTAAASPFKPRAAALACLLACTSAAQAQAQSTAPIASLAEIVIQSSTVTASPDVSGFTDQPLANTPLSATVISSDEIINTGARRLSDLYRLDASVADAYNAGGYYDCASVRGFVIDNTYNYRREGLPISA